MRRLLYSPMTLAMIEGERKMISTVRKIEKPNNQNISVELKKAIAIEYWQIFTNRTK